MKNTQNSSSRTVTLAGCIAASLALITVGCQAPGSTSSTSNASAPTSPAATATATAATAPATTANRGVPVHILAGYDESITKNGVTWLGASNFFADGETIARPDITIATSAETGPDVIYKAERYSMTKFTYSPVPNGDYTVKLHFCETYEGITGPGMRIFGYKVQGDGPAVKDFDLFATAGALKPVVKTVPIIVTNHTVEVDFTSQEQNPQINAIEIFPGY
jgi:hypothetical protein